MVKEFGDQFEEFTLEFFKRVVGCPVIIRDYGFRKKGTTTDGKTRNSPTDLDVLAIAKNKIYAVTCQEQIPIGGSELETETRRLIDNLDQALRDIKANLGWENHVIVPIIAFKSTTKDGLRTIDQEVEQIINQRVYLLTFKDMIVGYIKKLERPLESWIPAGHIDWVLSRLVSLFKGSPGRLPQLIEAQRSSAPKYTIICNEDIKEVELRLVSPFPF